MGEPRCVACGQPFDASPACDTWACDPCPVCGQCRGEGPAHRRSVAARPLSRNIALLGRLAASPALWRIPS